MMSGREKSRAEGLAEAMGVVVGAASNCDGVAEDRLNATVTRIGTLLSAAAVNEDDAEAARQSFHAGFAAGKEAVESGKVDRLAVETALNDLEESLPA
jgi:hypothetical protein